MVKGWFSVVVSVFAFVALLGVLSPDVHAAPQGICSSNGYPTIGLDGDPDCSFRQDPAIFYGCPIGQTVQHYCDGAPSKYQSGCVGTTYHDFSGVSVPIQIIRTANSCTSLGNICPNARLYYNDPRCGYVPPATQPPTVPGSGTPTSSGGGYTPVSTPSYFPYCGNGVCEYGEDMFSCPYDCSLFIPFPFISSCSLSSNPYSVTAGSSSTIAVNYYNTPFSPQSTLVSCGNGQTSFAYGCYGFSGVCFATCYYPQSGVFTATANAGGTFCSGTRVSVSGFGGGVTPPPITPPPVVITPVPTPVPSPSCAVSTNPSSLLNNGTAVVTVLYNNFQGTPNGNIVCGDGQSIAAACSGAGQGSCTASCTYTKPAHLPSQFIVTSTLNGISCRNGGVAVSALNNPGSLLVTVVNSTFDPLAGAAVQVDNGAIQFSNLSGQVQYTLNAGDYSVRASKPQFSTAVTSAHVVSDVTTQVTLQLTQRFNTFCQVAATPATVRGGSSSVVTVSYLDAPSVPQSVTINCGNGQTSVATCSGTPASGQCTAACNYGADGSLPNTFTVSSSVSGLSCNSQSVTVVPPLPGSGSLLARVSACFDGRLLSNAQLRISSPSSQIPVNFSGDGIYSLTPAQTVRADNGFIVRMDSSAQLPSTQSTLLSFSTGSQNFPNSAGDAATVGQSFVNISSTIPNAFSFNGQNVSSIYYDVDSLSAGNGTQGLVFYQSPTTGFFFGYLSPNAEGTVTYPSGTAISGSALGGVSILNTTANAGCNSTFTSATNLGSFSNYVLSTPITFNAGRPTVNGFVMSGFSGTAQVSATSVNASCSPGNFTLSFSGAAGSISPGLGIGQYAITYNYVDFNYAPTASVTMQLYAPAITSGPNDPNAGNGYAIAIPEYLTQANVTMGAWMLDVGYGDQASPRLLSAIGPANVGYNALFASKNITADVQSSPFLSPRGSVGSTALTTATINYALNLSGPGATVSFLTPMGALIRQNVLRVGESSSTANVVAAVQTIAGNTSRLDIRSLTAATPSNTTIFYTNEFGEANAQLSPGTYNLEVVKDGYNSSRSTVTIDQARTNTQAICLAPRACDFAVQLVSAPTCQFNSDQYQLQITNSENVTKNVSLTYSTTEITGPQVVALLPHQSTIVNLRARSASAAISGQSLGVVNIAGPDACTSVFTLPLCIQQDIVIQATQPRLSGTPGVQVCEDVLVKNRALQTLQVALSASSSVPNVLANFAPNSFMISSLETKTVPLCLTPPSGFSGSATIALSANSPFGQANDSIALDVAGQTFFSTDFAGCPQIAAGRTTYYTLNVRNVGPSGDYVLHLDDNPITVRDDFVFQQLQQNEVRSVVIPLEPFGTTAGRHYFNAFLQIEGQSVFQQQVCFDVRGNSGAQLGVQPNPLDVPRGQTRSALLLVRNMGNLRAEYLVQTDGQPLSVRLSPSSFVLEPNAEQNVNVAVAAASSLDTKSYIVPLSVYARSSLQTTSDQYSVDVQCGTGQTQSVSCQAGSGSCSVNCGYLSTGTFTPSASVSGRSCSISSSSVRVIDSKTNTCILQATPNNVDKGAIVTVTASYDSLPVSMNGTLSINCGNGAVVTAQNCNGVTGACSAVCTYPSEGNFVVTAAQNSTSCFSALVSVGNPSATSCQISVVQNTIVKGDLASVQLRYYNLPTTGTSSSLNIPVFQGSENLLVNVVSTSGSISLSTAELTLFAVPPQQAFSGTTLRIPLRVKNENYFGVDNVLLYPDKLPSGFTAAPIPRFSLAPGQERNVDLVVDVSPTQQPATVSFGVVAESALTKPVRQTVLLTVLASPAQRLNLDVSINVVYRDDLATPRYILDMSVTNREPVALLVTPSLLSNQSWPASFQPTTLSLTPNAQSAEQGQVVPTVGFDPNGSYPAVVRFRSADGRILDVPVTLSKQGGSFLSGLVTFGDAGAFFARLFNGRFETIWWYIGVALLLLAVAVFFFGAMNWHLSRGG